MKKGNMILLGAGYLAGLLVALKFNKKSPASLEKDFAPGDDRLNNLGKNLLDIHKNLFEEVQDTVFSPENKKIISEYKEQFLLEIDSFKKDTEKELTVWKEKGYEKKDEIEARIQDLYNHRMELLEKAKTKGMKLVKEGQENGSDLVEEAEKMANKLFDQARKQLDAMYADIKRTIARK